VNFTQLTAALIGLAVTMSTPVMSQTETKSPMRTIRLDAAGSVKAKPDMAQVTVGVAADADTARAALGQNSAAMTRVVDAVKAAGLVEEDIQTVDFSVRPRFEQSKTDGKNTIVGYRVVNLIRITVRDVTKLGEILDKAVSLGSNEIGGIQFGVADPARLLDEARKRAMDTARRKAQLYAEAASAKLGRVVTIDEQATSPWRPQAYAASRADAKGLDTPIQAGEAEFQVTISVLWELTDTQP
jgi:hypothetical protein